jgi:hypothetical protein
MANSRVHLDHLIKRQSIRYFAQEEENDISGRISADKQDPSLRYSDLIDGWVTRIRKPDFQRETNAWTPQDCQDLLDTAIYGKIIPNIILWMNKENGLVYVLDGAHRLSVLRAWMLDDWGDKAGNYYQRRDLDAIKQTAAETRAIIQGSVGLFEDYKQADLEYHRIADEGKAPKAEMSEKRYHQANFYNRVVSGNITLYVQWESGDYESAEKSFLRINRSGQALDPWEATLIEYRNSSYARCIMSIANGGESGHYWPTPSQGTSADILEALKGFSIKTTQIYKKLFVPPFKRPISDLNVPFMVAPEYFQKHKYLLEILPLLTERKIAISDEKQIDLMKKDYEKPANIIITNANETLVTVENNMDHLVSDVSNSKSLSVVPLFYWYNHNGKFVRALFYGFVYWLLSGGDDDIKNRKIIFSINRDRFESILFDYKSEIAASLQLKAGAGLKATTKITEFIQDLILLLNANINKTAEQLDDEVSDLIQKKGLLYSSSKSKVKRSRAYSSQDKTTINIREMFISSIRCHICGGVVNIRQGIQYDHSQDYAVYGITDPETGKPTHPFCNNFKKQIQDGRNEKSITVLPKIKVNTESKQGKPVKQFSFWGDSEFPE